jgi:hypothetical protein
MQRPFPNEHKRPLRRTVFETAVAAGQRQRLCGFELPATSGWGLRAKNTTSFVKTIPCQEHVKIQPVV